MTFCSMHNSENTNFTTGHIKDYSILLVYFKSVQSAICGMEKKWSLPSTMNYSKEINDILYPNGLVWFNLNFKEEKN